MDFSLLSRKKELMITTSTNSAVNSIGRSTVHTTLEIKNRVEKIIIAKLVRNDHMGLD